MRMTAFGKVHWKDKGPGKGKGRAFMSRSVQQAAEQGLEVIGSEMHSILIRVAGRLTLSDAPVDPIPRLEHEVVLSAEMLQELEDLVISPTLVPQAQSQVLIVAVGPTGAGKTTAKSYCAARIAQECEGKLAFFDLPAGFFRRSYWGESEAVTRQLFDSALRLGEQGYRVFVAFEDSESTLQSRRWSQSNVSGCGSTASAITSEILHGLGRLADAPIGCTVFTSSNYSAYEFDPALTGPHRLRGVIRFGTLPPAMVPDVVEAHAKKHEVESGVADWLTQSFTAPTVLARGRMESAALEVTLEDALTPSLIAGVFGRAHLFARQAAIVLHHAAKAFGREVDLLANRIASHSKTGDIGMIVPRLAEASGLQLKSVFDPKVYLADALLDGVLVPG